MSGIVPFATIPVRLTSEGRKALRNGEYTVDEVREIEMKVIMQHQIMRRIFWKLVIIMVSILVFAAVVSVSQMGDPVFRSSMLITGGTMALIVMLFKWFFFDALKRGFYRAVKKGYPSLFES